MIRTMIVEDEPLARELLRSYIARHPDLDLIGEASDGIKATQMIEELGPDLVLLDVALPERSGLEVLRTTSRHPAVVFTTAYDAHAIAAFELGAFDYLLKPFTARRFAQALGRVRERRPSADHEPPFVERIASPSEQYLRRFFVRHNGKMLPVYTPEIVRLEADDDYTAVHVNSRCLLVHVPLRDMESRLDPKDFVRVHRSSIVNLAHVRSAERSDRRIVLCMSDGAKVTSSRTHTPILATLFT